MATLVLDEATPLAQAAAVQLVQQAVHLNRTLGNPAVPR